MKLTASGLDSGMPYAIILAMIRNYLRVAWRTLRNNKAHSFINISGLAIGMAVAMLIGLWIWDELSFDHYDPQYKRVAQIMQSQTFNGATRTQKSIPVPLGTVLHKSYGNDLKYIVMTSGTWPHIVSAGDKMLNQGGTFMEPDAPKVLGLRIIDGSEDGLRDPSSILLSQSVATALFGKDDPLHKLVRLDDKDNFSVAGVYADLPDNSTFHQKGCFFIAPWDYYAHHILAKGKSMT